MININLKPGGKRPKPKGDSMAGLRQRMQGLRESVKSPGLVLAGGTWLAVLLVIGGLTMSTRSRLGTLETKFTESNDTYKRYKNFVNEKKREGKAKDSILAQIGTISSVDGDRFVWPHILDEIASSMPENTWLVSVSPVTVAPAQMYDTDSTTAAPVSILIAGQTNDIANYTSFLRRLGESHWLTSVVPVKTETIIDKANRPITAFTVQATFMRADSSRVQTVPILESVVR
jgi:Tfp pilus assembly protein PilN